MAGSCRQRGSLSPPYYQGDCRKSLVWDWPSASPTAWALCVIVIGNPGKFSQPVIAAIERSTVSPNYDAILLDTHWRGFVCLNICARIARGVLDSRVSELVVLSKSCHRQNNHVFLQKCRITRRASGTRKKPRAPSLSVRTAKHVARSPVPLFASCPRAASWRRGRCGTSGTVPRDSGGSPLLVGDRTHAPWSEQLCYPSSGAAGRSRLRTTRNGSVPSRSARTGSAASSLLGIVICSRGVSAWQF